MKAVMTRSALLAAVILLVSGGSAFAFGARVVVRPGFVYRPYYYSAFWGPAYPFAYVFPSSPHPSQVELQVTPKQAQVYVDGYFAGEVDDLHSHKVPTTPGGHLFTLYLDGYRTVTEQIYVSPHKTYKLQDMMEPLAPGEQSAPVPPPAPPPAS